MKSNKFCPKCDLSGNCRDILIVVSATTKFIEPNTITDTANNSITDTVTISINKADDQDPSISSFSADDTTVELKTSSQTQTVTFTAVVSDNVAINSVSLPGTTLSSSNAGTYVFTKEYDYDDYSFGSSSDTLTLTVSDTAGNSVTDTVTISITKSDDQNPSISSFGADDTSVTLATSSQTLWCTILKFTEWMKSTRAAKVCSGSSRMFWMK